MNVRIKRLRPEAVIPQYQTPGAAAFDLCAAEDGVLWGGDTALVGTGLAFEIPAGHVMLLMPRSGLGAKGVILANTVGVIDSDYRGEVKLALHYRYHHRGDAYYHYAKGHRLAQALIVPVARAEFNLVDELSETDRGAGGFGSTGA